MKSTSSELQIDGRPAVLRSTATRTIGSLGAQEIIPNEGATKDGLLAKVWLYFRGDSQDAEIGVGVNSGVVGDPGSGHVGLESLEFINNNQAIAPRINESLSGFDAFTIGCWVRFNSFNFGGPFAGWNSVSIAQGQLLFYNSSGNSNTVPEFGVAYGSNFYTVTAKSNSWKVNYWHYCLCEVDRTSSRIRMWIDNKLQGETALPSGFTLNAGTENFGLGGYNFGAGGFTDMSGNIEEFVIFDDVLTSTERDWLWNKSYGNTLQVPYVAPPVLSSNLKERIVFGFSGVSTTSDIGVFKTITTGGTPSGVAKTGTHSLSFSNQNVGLSVRFNSIIRNELQITIGCWVRFNTFNYAGPFASWDSNSILSGQIICYNPSGGTPSLPAFGIAYGGNFYEITAPSNAWIINTWHYVLCEIDRINLISRMWIDNNMVGTIVLPSGFILNEGNDTLGLGGYANGVQSVTDMNGYIDDFFIAVGNTTPAERNWLWNNGNGNSLLLL